MKLFLLVTIVGIANGNPLPKMLTEEQFLSSGGDGDQASVDIVSGYAQIRRQGRNFGSGDKFKYTKPVTVKDPADFQPPSDARKVTFDDEKAPVFNLNQIINEEAEKLKAQIEIASLMAAHAAENAANRITEAVKEAEADVVVDTEQVEKIIEKVVDIGILEAEEMVKSELEGESEVKIEEETAKPEIKIEIEEVTPPPVIEEIKPEIEEVKVEETPLPVEEVKNTNVEWAQDEEPTTSPTESKSTEDEKIEHPEDLIGEKVFLDDEVKEEIQQTTNSVGEENLVNKSDETNSSAATTDSSHPPQDLDLGSVQEV